MNVAAGREEWEKIEEVYIQRWTREVYIDKYIDR